MRPATTHTSKHHQEHWRCANKHKEHRQEDESIVWAEMSRIGYHISLKVYLDFTTARCLPDPLHNSAWVEAGKLVPWPQVASRRCSVRSRHVARHLHQSTALLGDHFSKRSRSQLVQKRLRVEACQGQRWPAASFQTSGPSRSRAEARAAAAAAITAGSRSARWPKTWTGLWSGEARRTVSRKIHCFSWIRSRWRVVFGSRNILLMAVLLAVTWRPKQIIHRISGHPRACRLDRSEIST
mmetsp:Transcript_45358/g.105907  ORF Transcript_45358/g.105907 Transcript_45358/m.105907 type:complete len:239 (+) Transcript_45358:429-1145(+)